MRKVVILTALKVEYKAVRAHLTAINEVIHPKGTIYEKGIFSANGRSCEVCLLEIGMGGERAATETERVIEFFKPDAIFFVGVAGSLKNDVRIGDVVAATKVYGYEAGKASEIFLSRPNVGNVSYGLEQRARAESHKSDWLKRLTGPVPQPEPEVHVGPLAAGSKVLASKHSETWELLQHNFSDALAVEMEAHGFLQAAHASQEVQALVIRGISDHVSGKAQADRGGSQDRAARHASAFAFEMLAKLAEAEALPAPPNAAPVRPAASPTPAPNTAFPGQGPARTPGSPVKIFYSYIDTDKKLIEDLKKHLAQLRWQKQIEEWDAAQILPGADSMTTLLTNLKQAEIIILGISPDYISSEQHYMVEMIGAMNERQFRQVRVIPVLLRPTLGIDDLPTRDLVLLPRNRKPINEDRGGEALAEVAGEIRRTILDLRKS